MPSRRIIHLPLTSATLKNKNKPIVTDGGKSGVWKGSLYIVYVVV